MSAQINLLSSCGVFHWNLLSLSLSLSGSGHLSACGSISTVRGKSPGEVGREEQISLMDFAESSRRLESN